MPVWSTHPDYDKMLPKWQRCRDAISGQDAMHAAGTRYLPKLKDEPDDEYKGRVGRSDFWNATWRTIAGLGGMAFRKPPTVEVPSAIEAYLEDVNLAGVSLEGLARDALDEILGIGRLGLLVDHPERPEKIAPITIDVAEKLGLRPTIQCYPAESIINWKFGRIANAWRLTMVVLKESELVAKDEFSNEREDRWRVLDLITATNDKGKASLAYRQRLFRKDKKGKEEQIGKDRFPLKNGAPLDYIPFALLGADGLGDTIDEPPLIDLVDKNVAHYQVNSDYRHGLHFTGLPTPYVTGWSPPTDDKGVPTQSLFIGSTTAWIFTEPDAKVGFLEFQGQGLEANVAALDRLERQMALLGARMIADETKQAETLGATHIKRQGENSVLARIVTGVSAGLEWALTIFAQWAGHSGKIVYQINRDFLPAGMDAQQLNALLAAVAAGEMSSESFFALMQRADLIAPEVTYDDERERIDSKGPARPMKPKAAEEEDQAA